MLQIIHAHHAGDFFGMDHPHKGRSPDFVLLQIGFSHLPANFLGKAARHAKIKWGESPLDSNGHVGIVIG